MEKLIEVFNEAKEHLLSLNIQGISIVLENDSIILFAGKKEIGSSIRIYNSKTFSKFLYCYGNFQNEIEENKILAKLKDDIQKLKEAYESKKHKSPLMQFIQERNKELNITKDNKIHLNTENDANKLNVNKLESADFNSLIQNNINDYREKQKQEGIIKYNKEKKLFEDKVNAYFNKIKIFYRQQLVESSKKGMPFISFDFRNNIQTKSKGEELLLELKNFKSYDDLISLLDSDKLDYTFEVSESISEKSMYYMAMDDIDYSSPRNLDDTTYFYLHFTIRIKNH